MSVEATCAGCGEQFEAQRRSKRWCSEQCRMRARTKGAKGEAESPEPDDCGLRESVRRELETNDAVDTFAGQLALQLAKRLSSPDESGISSLSKELRTVMAAALEGRTPPAGEEPEDEVDQARRRRDEKARAAAG